MTTNLEWMHDNDRERLRLDLECGPCEGCQSTPDPSKTFCEWLMAEHEEEPEVEPDTREKIEAEVREHIGDMCGTEVTCSDCEITVDWILSWLDRQAAITMREAERICDSCEWPGIAATPDQESIDLIEYQRREIDELRAELRTSRMQLKEFEDMRHNMLAALGLIAEA